MGNKQTKRKDYISPQKYAKAIKTGKPSSNAIRHHNNTFPKEKFMLSFAGKGKTEEISKFVVYGFLRCTYQHIIPDDIVSIIILHYQHLYPRNALFCNRDYRYSKCLKFTNRRTVIKATKFGYGSCLFRTPICNEKYQNKYAITIKINYLSTGFMFGYVSSRMDMNYDECIGRNENKYYSVGLYAPLQEDRLELYDETTDDYGKELNYQYENVFDSNSIFIMLFDFENDDLTIYHGAEKGQKLSLNQCKILTPGFTLFDESDLLEIIEWKKGSKINQLISIPQYAVENYRELRSRASFSPIKLI